MWKYFNKLLNLNLLDAGEGIILAAQPSLKHWKP